MQTNAAGVMIEDWWARLESKFPWITADESIVMPNHLHGILLVGADPRVRPGGDAGSPDVDVGADPRVRPPGGERAEPLPKVMQWFKTMTTNAYIRGVKTEGWEPFQARLWQRSYYERVIRNEDELYHARRYIAGNPAKWTEDVENPANIRRSA